MGGECNHENPCADLRVLQQAFEDHAEAGKQRQEGIQSALNDIKLSLKETNDCVHGLSSFRRWTIGIAVGASAVLSGGVTVLTLWLLWKAIPHG